MPICNYIPRTSTRQDIGNYPIDLCNALFNLGDIYFGSSRPVDQVVRNETYYQADVVIDCDEVYYTGVFDPLIYEYFINKDDVLRGYDHTYLPKFLVARFLPPMSTMRHISDASCCFRVFVCTVYNELILDGSYSSLRHTVETYGVDGAWSPCLRCISLPEV